MDDLRPELGCYGVRYIHSPHIDALASSGRTFQRHYVQAPTCGASRYAMLTGRYGPTNNKALFTRAAELAREKKSVSPSMPAWFRKYGYTTVSVGKVSHHPGGWGGSDWDDPNELEMPYSWNMTHMPSGLWQHPRGAMHGLAHGEIRSKAGGMDVYQTVDGPDSTYPDGLITETALEELETLSTTGAPFFLAVGFIRPHLPFGAPAQYFDPYSDAELPPIPHPEKPTGQTTWHASSEFMKYNRWGQDPNMDPDFALEVRRHYAASVTYADAQVGRLLRKLQDLGLDRNTIVVLWGDHGWHLGEHAIWGKHSLFEESLRSPLIIRSPQEPAPGESTNAIVESIDIFPTLCELAGLPTPETLHGSSLTRHLKDPSLPGHTAISYARKDTTIRTDSYRLIAHDDGHLELYDHTSAEGETRNIANRSPEITTRLLHQIQERLQTE